ncbi:hypothetical protein [Natronorubrum texcoconense]|uniref:Uncharacterized protein n=1 Tax=Natronorubrum texcoconense TaxID=1095776 RepID=A0A1G9BK30_9EURY|nr:hypothetical protein [Natronorubrum texcoconense]SDK39832.1 hypothetical protein SAMN04515672_2992 [Natronorubrum texcoconense]
MYRRAVLAGSTAALLAGCSEVTGLMDDGYVDDTLQDEEPAEFGADAGDELAVSVTVQEINEGNAVSVQVAEVGEGPLDARSIEESDSYDVTIESDGAHVVTVTNGVAEVTVEPVE